MSNAYQDGEAFFPATDTYLGAGNFVVTIDEADTGESSNGHPQIEMRMSNGEGSIRDWLVITSAEFTQDKVRGLIASAGIAPPDDSEVDGLALKQKYVDKFVGKKVGIVVREEPDYKDPTRMRARVQGYRPSADIAGSAGPIASSSQPPNSQPPAKADRSIPFHHDGFPERGEQRGHDSRW